MPRLATFGSIASIAFLACAGCFRPPPSEDAIRHNEAGVERLLEGRVDEARAHFEVALEYRPRFAEARANLGALLLRQGALDRAEATFRRAIRDDPDLAVAHANLGVTLERAGRLDEARRAYRQAIAIDPSTHAARFNLARILALHGEARAAWEELFRLHVQYPEEIGVLGALILAELRIGEVGRASARVAEAASRDETHPLMHLARGVVSALEGDLDEAIVELELARADPSLEEAALARIAALERLAGRHEAADEAARGLPERSVIRAVSIGTRRH